MSAADKVHPLKEKTLRFGCGPEVPCFGDCCSKLNLMLTPYDILRLARRLQMSTTELLERHTFAVEEKGKLPRVRLDMREEDNRCPFLTEKGCQVYEDRPSACRAYPLARAARTNPADGKVREAFFVVREEHCKGFGLGSDWTPEEWSRDQGLDEYTSFNDSWMNLLTGQSDVIYGPEAERRTKMFNLASYDLDTFRRFVLESGLVDKLGVPEARVAKLAENDEELLRFAVQWLDFALYGKSFNVGRA